MIKIIKEKILIKIRGKLNRDKKLQEYIFLFNDIEYVLLKNFLTQKERDIIQVGKPFDLAINEYYVYKEDEEKNIYPKRVILKFEIIEIENYSKFNKPDFKNNAIMNEQKSVNKEIVFENDKKLLESGFLSKIPTKEDNFLNKSIEDSPIIFSNEGITFNWDELYKKIEIEPETIDPNHNKLLQQTIDKTFQENKRQLYISKLKVNSMDYNILKFFTNSDLNSFIYREAKTLTLDNPKPILLNDFIKDPDFWMEKYISFIKKTWLEKVRKKELNQEEFVEKINDEIKKKFKKINAIANDAKKNYLETGNWSTYIGWPFIEGKIANNSLRTPLAYFPIEITKHLNHFTLKHIELPIRINAQLVKGLYSFDKKILKNLKIDFENIEDVFIEYAKHNLKFQNQVNGFEPLSPILKKDFESDKSIIDYQLKNIFIIENRLWSEYVYIDSSNIYRDFGNFSIPKENKDIFGIENEELTLNKIVLNVDDNKNKIISLAQNDSLIIQGPPGTGKSEIITTFLALVSSNGKSSLLVAEKNAALNVVYERLEQKIGIGAFALKINGNGMKKKIFWENLARVINLLVENKYDPQELKHHQNAYLSFLKKQSEVINYFKDKKIDISAFWDYLSDYDQIISILPNDNNSLKQKWSVFLNEYENFKRNSNTIEALEHKKNEIKIEFEKIKLNLEKALNKINEILVPPLSYLSTNEISYEFLISLLLQKDKNLFKHISNGQWNFFNFNKQYKKNRDKLYELKNSLYELQKYKHDFENYNLENQNHQISLEIKQIESKTDSFIQKYMFDNDYYKKTFYKYINFDKNYFNQLCSLEEMFLIFINQNKKHNLHLKYIENKKEIQNIFKINKQIIKERIIISIRKKIKNNPWLTKDYKKIEVMTRNAKRKAKPIKILKKYFNIIKTLFPIIICTPNEVSQFFPNNPNIFDYGLFDEASQMVAERAFPSVHRSKKIIIAGDKMQLGPSFLYKTYIDDTEDIIDSDEDFDAAFLADSFLGWGENKYKNELLTYHYRSKSAMLIEYSNENFYNGKLIANDSPSSIKNPIEVLDVNGTWEKKINIEEAERIITLLEELVFLYRTIGIITMNVHQCDWIRERIWLNNNLKNYLDNPKEGRNIFVKNIENVQGDEADLIIFSLQYSTNNNTQPIRIPHILNKNRLNVAITRAKEKMIIVKSFTSNELGPGNIDSSKSLVYKWVKWLENKNEKKLLKNHPALNHGKIWESRSLFETEFIEMLQKEIPQHIRILNKFKINDYKLDVVFFDTLKEKYLAAVELDGFLYHNSHEEMKKNYNKTLFLENIGWNIKRISSLTFYKNKEKCVEKALEWLNLMIL